MAGVVGMKMSRSIPKETVIKTILNKLKKEGPKNRKELMIGLSISNASFDRYINELVDAEIIKKTVERYPLGYKSFKFELIKDVEEKEEKPKEQTMLQFLDQHINEAIRNRIKRSQ